MRPQNPATAPSALEARARSLGLYGLVTRWQEVEKEPWTERVIAYEEEERGRRSLERRIVSVRLGAFKPIADFDWGWPREIDHELIDELLSLQFVKEAGNVILLGPNGVGKTMIAKNLAYQAVLQGYTARFLTASELLNDLAAQEAGSALTRHYMRPQLLVIDEVAYLAASTRHADLLFELVSRRYQQKSIVLTTTKSFLDWNEVFPSSGCLVSLIDRLIHKSEIVKIDAESYRRKEAEERAAKRASERAQRSGKRRKAVAAPEAKA
jgi:DNA replication protein DnaC